MPSDREFSKRKNILDAYHQRYLNYFNIATISLITSIFSLLLGYFTEAIPINLIFSIGYFVILIFGSFAYISFIKMRDVMKEIKKL